MTYRVSLLLTFVALVTVILPKDAQAYTPESPKVRAAVERAAKYLEKAEISDGGDEGVGESALVALALLKAERGLEHPRIKSTLNRCVGYAGKMKADGEYNMYATSIVTIFLIEADAKKFRQPIQKLLGVIMRRQMRNGAWGYKEEHEGDTSQSQYCALALWEAYNHGIDVKLQDAANFCHWLIRTQDPEGAFGYKGQDSGALGKRVNQSEVSHSLAAAGMGSLYVAMDLLGFQREDVGDDAESLLPRDVKLISEDEADDPAKKRKEPAIGLVHGPALSQAVGLGNNWFRKHEATEYGGQWQYYYMYGLERYQTFRDKVENRKIAEPKWYNDGVDYLLKKQTGGGQWSSRAHGGPATTCFAVFFLTRSTQKTIGALLLSQGVLKGGKGFQDGELRTRNGKIVTVPLSRSVGDLLATLDEGSEEDLVGMAASVAELKFDGDATTRTNHMAMLRGLVSHKSYGARIMAVKTLAKQRSLDNVPPLIYALSDPDWRVTLEARNGLRFISRKINGFGLSKQPKKGEVTKATEKWKAWFLSVRPDGQLFN